MGVGRMGHKFTEVKYPQFELRFSRGLTHRPFNMRQKEGMSSQEAQTIQWGL